MYINFTLHPLLQLHIIKFTEKLGDSDTVILWHWKISTQGYFGPMDIPAGILPTCEVSKRSQES